MKEELIPIIQPSYRNIGINHNEYRDQDNEKKQMTMKLSHTINDHNPYYQYLRPQCPKSIVRQIRTYKGMQKENNYPSDFASNTCNHSMIRSKAQERVLGILLKDEMKQIEETRLLQEIMIKNEEKRAAAIIKEQAKTLGNTFRSITFHNDEAEQIITTRAKLNKANHVTQDNSSLTLSKISTITESSSMNECPNTGRITSQRKFDLSSNIVNTIRNKTNPTTVITNTTTNNNIPLDTKSTVKSKDIINHNVNSSIKEKKELKAEQGSKTEDKISIRQEKRMKDLNQFLVNFTIKPKH